MIAKTLKGKMTLQKIADSAMRYLDDVGVAAEYTVGKPDHLDNEKLDITFDDRVITIISPVNDDYLDYVIGRLNVIYPQIKDVNPYLDLQY